MQVLHDRIQVSDAAVRGLEHNPTRIGGPTRPVLRTLRGRQTADGAPGRIQRKDIVVEKPVGVWLAIRNEQDLVASRRPIDGVLMIRPAGELANRSAHDVGGEYV